MNRKANSSLSIAEAESSGDDGGSEDATEEEEGESASCYDLQVHDNFEYFFPANLFMTTWSVVLSVLLYFFIITLFRQ